MVGTLYSFPSSQEKYSNVRARDANMISEKRDFERLSLIKYVLIDTFQMPTFYVS